MPREIQATIAFADVSRSTMLYERLGDHRARAAIADCVTVMSEATTRYGGVVVKTIGDEVLSAFRSADDAVCAMILIQEDITDRKMVDGIPLMIRAGFHYGTVLSEGGDVFGDAVNTAARLAGHAKPGQILTTGATVAQLSPALQQRTREVDRATVKGKRDPIAMYEVVRELEGATRMMAVPVREQRKVQRLVLRLGEVEARVDAERSSVDMGRGDRNDLVVASDLVSRLHARVEYRRGKFVLVDHSVNGTWVARAGGEETWLRRDELALDGAGLIGLGCAVQEGDPHAISFQLED